jgi:hypothetical protein
MVNKRVEDGVSSSQAFSDCWLLLTFAEEHREMPSPPPMMMFVILSSSRFSVLKRLPGAVRT